ncbi:MAG: 2'-deoxycytidine 5'-triphosphate deaminase [Acidimicrobiales bacterium]
MGDPVRLADLGPATPGVLPDWLLADAVDAGWVGGDPAPAAPSVQPASLDLRLGCRALRIRCSFLPDDSTVETKVGAHVLDELDLSGRGAVLETKRPYLIPLVEELALPPHVRGRANPKSSTGRLDVFTRVITDRSFRFDEVGPGYRGPLYLEVVPLSFPVRVRAGLALNQLRLMVGRSLLSDRQLVEEHHAGPLLYRDGRPATDAEMATADGLFLSLDLRGDAEGRVGYRSRSHAALLDMSQVGAHRVDDFWEPVRREDGDRVVLDPESFYLLLSEEAVAIPPHLACEMTAYDPTSGELRTHYAGFFDPGFGWSGDGSLLGSRAALEVRAHDVPFMIEHGQRVCKLTFERMVATPRRLYGNDVGSNYQGQSETLGKHFARGPRRR